MPNLVPQFRRPSYGFLTLVGGSSLVVILLVSCGPPDRGRYPVEGEVGYHGEIVQAGTIAFYPDGVGGPVAGSNIVEGRYAIDAKGGPVAGIHRVQIEAMKKTGRKVANMGGDLMDEYENFLPEKYTTPASEVRVEITAGRNAHNFDLD